MSHGGEIEPLTGRQREVLDLIARGYTNPQIADALGVSIDGAKWHVREILSKLGVESREEAAEWWRRERSVGTRLRRAARGGVGIGVLRWVAGGAAVALVGALAVVAVLAGRGDGQEVVGPEVTATVGASATVDPSASPTVAMFNRVAAQMVSAGPDIDLPRDIVVYYRIRIENAGGLPGLWRAYRESGGALRIDELTLPLTELGEIQRVTIDSGEATASAIVCVSGECGDGRVGPGADAIHHLFLSTDGGVSWSDTGETQLDAGPSAPTSPPLSIPDAVEVQLGPGGFDPSLVYWKSAEPPAPDAAKRRYFGFLNDQNQLEAAYDITSVTGAPLTRLDEHRMIGYGGWSAPSGEFHPAVTLLDLEAGTVAVIAELSRQYQTMWGPSLQGAALIPGSARINIPGDCLNLRAGPGLGSELLGCVADGVLVEVTGERIDADGVSWTPVRAPGAGEGWVSGAYLE